MNSFRSVILEIWFLLCEFKSDGHHYPEKTTRKVAQQSGRSGCKIFTEGVHFSVGYTSVFQTNPNSMAQGAIKDYGVIQCITRIL
jgi:hypothetical protein